MGWKPASPDLVRRFREATQDLPGPVEYRTMFGCPCGFVHGKMFGGVFGDRIFVRLPEHAREGLKPFEPKRGRRMREYFVISPDTLQDREQTEYLLQIALKYSWGLASKKKR